MYKIFLFSFMSLIYSQDSKLNDNIYTLTEFEIGSINTFRESGFHTLSDFTVINNLLVSNFYSSDSEIHFGMYIICLANDNLDSLENSLNHLEHMDSAELRSEAKEMIDDCSKNEIKKVLKLLIDIARKSFED